MTASRSEERELRELFERLRAGDPTARERVFVLLYDRLRHVAALHMRDERADHTLGATSLVHDVYLRLCGAELPCADRLEFLRLASAAMRRVLIDSARRREARRRALEARGESAAAASEDALRDERALAIADALERLAARDEQLARIVELRFFAGLGVEDTAAALGVSSATVKRGWRTARAWLHRELEQAESGARGAEAGT